MYQFRKYNTSLIIITALFLATACNQVSRTESDEEFIEISYNQLEDKITGGIIGQFFGNLNGLEHENNYTNEPGDVQTYVPDLSGGAVTDDDTDIEFVYIYTMREKGEIMLPYPEIRNLWMTNISTHIWCSNRYARNLMDMGLEPPYTGMIALNPWASFNISGQFLCEQFALISPGMPQTASKIGSHYTSVAVDGEPIQTTQFYTSLISMAFFEDNISVLISKSLDAVDPQSEIHGLISRVIEWHKLYPDDWRAARRLIRDTYWNGEFGGAGGTNGYRTITAATVAALLYGDGDFVESVRLAFNFGWDADNTAAMVGTVVGVIKGEKWFRQQGWTIKDEYRNNRRPALPDLMTIKEFSMLHIDLAEIVIQQNGGKKIENGDQVAYRIDAQTPKVVNRLPVPLDRVPELQNEWREKIIADLEGDKTSKARAAYMAIRLNIADDMMESFPQKWNEATTELRQYYHDLLDDDQWTKSEKSLFREYFD